MSAAHHTYNASSKLASDSHEPTLPSCTLPPSTSAACEAEHERKEAVATAAGEPVCVVRARLLKWLVGGGGE